MTVTRLLYVLASYNVLWSVIQAYQPDAYLGCFEDFFGDSLVNPVQLYRNTTTNKGDLCKAACKYRTKRYAGTKRSSCYCGSGVVQNRKRSSTECNEPCPGNSSETCGGSYEASIYNRISLYDTWLCITGPCQNGATCTDINAESYICSCSVGWTGRVCNEIVATTTYTLPQSPSTQAVGSSTVVETVNSTTYTEPQSPSTQTTYTKSQSPSTQTIGNSTVAAPPEGNKLAIYIAVPVSIVVIIVFVLIVTVLILRKKLNQKKKACLQATYQNSTNAATGDNDHNYDGIDQTAGDSDHNYDAIDRTGDNDHNYHAVDRTGDSDHNYHAVDRTGNSDHNYDAINRTGDNDHNYHAVDRTGDSDHNYYSIDQTAGVDRNYSNIGRHDKGSAIHNDDSGYGNLSFTT